MSARRMAMLALGAPEDSHYQQEQRARAAAEKCATEMRALMPITGTNAEQPVGNTRDQDNKADLCQQIRMAAAAEDAAWYAKWQFVISIGGLVGVGAAAIYAGLAYSIAKKALFDLERPHVFVEVISPGLTVDERQGSFSLLAKAFRYRIINYGRSPARMLDITLRYPTAGFPPDMPKPLPSNDPPDRILPDGIVSALDYPYEEGENLRPMLPHDIYGRNAIYQRRIFFLGRTRYADIFNNIYVIGFCFVFDHIGLRFVRVGDERYNYTRKE